MSNFGYVVEIVVSETHRDYFGPFPLTGCGPFATGAESSNPKISAGA